MKVNLEHIQANACQGKSGAKALKRCFLASMLLLLGMFTQVGTVSAEARAHLVFGAGKYSEISSLSYIVNNVNCACEQPFEFGAVANFVNGPTKFKAIFGAAEVGQVFGAACPEVVQVKAILTSGGVDAVYSGSIVKFADGYQGSLSRQGAANGPASIQIWELEFKPSRTCS